MPKASPLTPDMLLNAYANGYFPMAMGKDDPELYWFSPEERGVLPLEAFNIPRGLKRALKEHPFTLTVDRDFEGVMRGCAEVNATREDTWINEEIITLYTALHAQGHAHSVEVWEEDSISVARPLGPLPHRGRVRVGAELARQCNTSPPPNLPPTGGGTQRPCLTNKKLVGGLYGVSLGGAFFGESMFSRVPNASKIALVMLVEVLNEAGYELLDTQYVNDHLKQFGVLAMPKETYMTKLAKALKASPNPSTRFSTASVRRGLASSSSANLT